MDENRYTDLPSRLEKIRFNVGNFPIVGNLILPAVDLIQIGDVFVVKDGHHCISVTRVMGEEFIDANVTRWRLK